MQLLSGHLEKIKTSISDATLKMVDERLTEDKQEPQPGDHSADTVRDEIESLMSILFCTLTWILGVCEPSTNIFTALHKSEFKNAAPSPSQDS